jgi:4-hydroxy-2-oxoheptanedioate aldolase
VAEALATLGVDFVNLDRQHGAIDDEATLAMIAVIDRSGTPVYVRVPAEDSALIGRVLDMGATGVIVPMVETTDAAERAVAAARYPPRGRRSWGPMRAGFYAEAGGVPADGLVLVMLETALAIERASEILSVPGVAGAVVGPADLAQSLGLGPSAVAHDEVLARCREVVAACHERGLVAATGAHSTGLAETWVRLGFDMIAIGRDVPMLRELAAERLRAVRAFAAGSGG